VYVLYEKDKQPVRPGTRNKSLFASFSSEKEDPSFIEKKKQKNFYCFEARLER
jgi:hypothetical protein